MYNFQTRRLTSGECTYMTEQLAFSNSNFFNKYYDDTIRRLEAIKQRSLDDMEKEIIREKLSDCAGRAVMDKVIVSKPGVNATQEFPLWRLLHFIFDENTKPIMSPFGTFFDQHERSVNKSADMLTFLGNTRKLKKKEMEKYPEESIEYVGYDREQKVYKLYSNSYYVALGQESFLFFNKLLGPSVKKLHG